MGTESSRMTELQDDLRATAEDMAADAERVREIETEKSDLPVDHPRTARLSVESEALTAQMAEKAKAQMALVEKAQTGGAASEAAD
jgi:hypothetical protein